MLGSLQICVCVLIATSIAHELVPNTEKTASIFKRSDLDLEMCAENFDVHLDKIIRTDDSLRMGARYLNEVDVSSRGDCLRLCCQTDSCDVFIFEEKSPGSCYLFHCGLPDDFKCKFTKHHNYTSAVLTINKHLNELESQIKLTKHEKDLNRLRKPQPDIQDGTSSVAPILLTTTQPKVVPATSDSTAGRQCSRYQFECRGSGECIAIYNACDGIVQCPDGSDEGPELGCPGPAVPPGTTAPAPTIVPRPVLLPSWNQEQAPPALKRPYERTELSGRYVTDQKGPMQREPPQALPPRNEIYGREGEGYGGAVQWPDYQPRQQQYKQMGRDYQEAQKPSSSGHIFNHKSSGLMMVEADRNIPSPSKMKVPAEEGPLPQYVDNGHTDNKYYNRQPGPPPPWTSNNHGSVPDDYYYEDPQETGRIHGHPSRQHPLLQPELVKVSGQSLGEVQPGPDKPQGKDSIDVYVVRNPKHPSSTPVPTTVTTVVPSVVKAKALPGPVEIPEDTVEVELVVDKENNPRGAILSLALGLCITAIMAVLVGCRLRVVRRRLRRGGKSPYAHDADYLVNGMYL